MAKPLKFRALFLTLFLFFSGIFFAFPTNSQALDVTLSWNASNGATGYKIYYDILDSPAGPPYEGTGALEGNSPVDVGDNTQFTLHDLPGNGYRFSLTAYNDYGESGFSVEMILYPPEYALTVSSNGNGSVSPNSGTFYEATDVQLTATPDTGWEFSGWSGDLSGSTNPVIVTMNANKVITATFIQLPNTYTLITGKSGNGQVTPLSGTFNDGTAVTLNATPDTGWEFSGWGGDLSGSTNPVIVTMNSDKVITATFIQLPNTYTLITGKSGNGQVTPSSGTYNEGTAVTLSATPNTGWEFVSWSGSLSGTTNPAIVTMNSDKVISATFLELTTTYTLSTEKSGNGQVTPSSGTYDESTTVTVSATPDSGWAFSGWSGDLNGSTTPVSLTMNADKHVVATFTQISPLINAFAATPEKINSGESVVLAWNVSRATSVVIDNGIGDVDPSSGSVTIEPPYTQTYQITATNEYGSDTAYVTVQVGTQIENVIPLNRAGMDDNSRIAIDTSFGVQINDPEGIDITNPNNIRFTIDDGTSFYVRDLSDDSVVTVTRLLDEADSNITRFWAAYHRSAEPILGDYDFGSEVQVQVEILNNEGETIQAEYQFGIETEEEYNQSELLAPEAMHLSVGDIQIEGYDAGIEITSGDLKGASIVYDSNGPVQPRFGSVDEMPPLGLNAVNGVGLPMNLQPHTVFMTPATLLIPCPEKADVSNLCVYLFNGRDWLLACDAQGNLQPDGEGWMVPGSRVNHNNGSPSTIEIQVYHFSGAWATSSVSAVGSSGIGIGGGGGGGGSGCFIATAAFGSPLEKHVEILKRFRDVYLLPNKAGHAFVMFYYRYSPPIADFIARHTAIKLIVRVSLMPLIGFSYILLKASPFEKAIIIFMVLAVCMSVRRAFVMNKRRSWRALQATAC